MRGGTAVRGRLSDDVSEDKIGDVDALSLSDNLENSVAKTTRDDVRVLPLSATETRLRKVARHKDAVEGVDYDLEGLCTVEETTIQDAG